VGKTGEKKYILRLTQRWEDIIQMDYKKVSCDDVDWIYLAQDMWWAVVNTVMDLSVSLDAENFLCS